MKGAGAAVAILLSLLIAACGGQAGDPAETAPTTRAADSGLKTLTIETSGGEDVEVRVEVADDEAERARGLMNRTELGENRGMLFVFEREQQLSFWMKDTLIPLSVAYIDSEERIVDMQGMEPLDDEPPHYVSAEPAQYALEVNRNFFEENGVRVGDRVRLPT